MKPRISASSPRVMNVRWLMTAAVLMPCLVHADALEWLQRMNQAVRENAYSGVAVYRSGDQLETLQVLHRWHDGREQERIVSLSGSRREVVRDANSVTCVLPENKAVVLEDDGPKGLLPKLPRAAFEQLQGHYEMVELEDTSRIAGRVCRGIVVRARDEFRYSYELWLDEETAVPLSIRLLDGNLDVLEQVMFTQVQFDREFGDEEFTTSVDTTGFRRLGERPQPDDVPQGDVLGLQLEAVPPGFRLANRARQRLPGVDELVTHWLYTDGLATVSVFAAPEPLPERAFKGFKRMGGVNAYGRMVGGVHLMVVGEVPQETVRALGDAAQLGDADAASND